MTRDELARMLDAYRDGEIALPDAERLARAIRERGEDSLWVLAEIETAGMIAQALDDTGSEEFLRGFRERVRAEEASEHFVHDFEEKRADSSGSRTAADRIVPFAIAHPSRRGWWITAAAAMVVLGAGAALWVGPHDAPMARLEQVQGEVVLVQSGTEKRVHSGQRLLSGDGLRIIGEEGSATVVFRDGTWLEFGADTIVTSLIDADTGKRVTLSEGFLTAQVARQPEGRAMILETPQSEVVVLGTAFSLSSGTAVTYLETQSGKVRLDRRSDGRSVEVPAGFKAIDAAGGGALVAQPLGPRSREPRLRLEGYWTGTLLPEDLTLAVSSYLKGGVEIRDARTGLQQSAFRAHANRVSTVAFSPDGRTLVTGSVDGTVKLWEHGTGRLQGTLSPESGAISQVVFSPEGRFLTVMSTGEQSGMRTLTSWDPETREQIWKAQPFRADHWAFSPDGTRLAATSRQEKTVTLRDLNSGEVESVLTEPAPDLLRNVFSMAFSHDGKTLAVDGSSGLVTLWDIASGEVRTGFERQGGRVFGMTFSPDDRRLATGHQDGAIRLWDLEASSLLAVLGGQSQTHARAMQFTPDGGSLLTHEIRLATRDTSRDGILQLWDLSDPLPPNPDY